MLMSSLESRPFAIAVTSILIATASAFSLVKWAPETRVKDVTLLYVGAQDCAPCRAWQKNQAIAFRSSPDFRRLSFREVKSSTLYDVLNDSNWPPELRAYRQAIRKGAGVPLWLVIADETIVMQSSGLAQWQEAVLPKIQSLLR